MTQNDRIEITGLLLNLIEEAAEVNQIAAKCLRFGLDSYDPNDPKKTPNRVLLAQELGNLTHIKNRLTNKAVISTADVVRGMEQKMDRLEKYPLIVTDAGSMFGEPQ